MVDGESEERRRGVTIDDGDVDEWRCSEKELCDCDALPLAILLYAAVLPYPDAVAAGEEAYERDAGALERANATLFCCRLRRIPLIFAGTQGIGSKTK